MSQAGFIDGRMPIIVAPYLTVDGEPYNVRRSLRERLFSRPWRPWVCTRTIVPQIPDPSMYSMLDPISGRQTIVAHPETFKRVKHELANQEESR